MRKNRARGRDACAFYATDDDYALGVLVAVEQLRQLGQRSSTEIVLLHHGVSKALLRDLETRGVRTLPRRPLPFVRDYTYRHCLTKLHVLGLTDYDRVVFLDADGFPLRPLDALLDLPLAKPIAAVRAHWVKQSIFFSTMLLVVEPSAGLSARVEAAFSEAWARGDCDMDIFNRVFANEIEALPDGVACLNSEFDRLRGPFYFGDPEETLARVTYVHFTALGKPWFYRPARARKLRTDAHPAFHRLWEAWWRVRDQVRPEGFRDRLRRHLLQDLGLRRAHHLVARNLHKRLPLRG